MEIELCAECQRKVFNHQVSQAVAELDQRMKEIEEKVGLKRKEGTE